MDILSYQLETAEQFWDELSDIVSGDYHSTATIERTLCAFLKLAAMYMEQYLAGEEELTRCGYSFIHSPIFVKNRAYVRRKLISLLTLEDLDIPNKILIGAVLLLDGKLHVSTLEMMQEEAASEAVISILWHDRHKSIRLHRIFLELLYEMCKVQQINPRDLNKISTAFLEFLFTMIENNDYYETDPYNYAVMKVLLALNEQYMIADIRHSNTDNKVFSIVKVRGNEFRTFGENLVFLFNRGADNVLQMMIMKFLYLVFTTRETYQYLYLNDLKVLVGVIVRELLNLSIESEKLRHTYLRVLHPLLQHTQIHEDQYKRFELTTLLETMSSESTVYDETTKRLAHRCLTIAWLEYAKAEAIPLPAHKRKKLPPPPPPPSRKKLPSPRPTHLSPGYLCPSDVKIRSSSAVDLATTLEGHGEYAQ